MRIKYEIIYLFLFCVAVEYITTGGTEQTRASLSWTAKIDEGRICLGIYTDADITRKGVRLQQRIPRVATTKTETGQ